jgi:hypothetical protein
MFGSIHKPTAFDVRYEWEDFFNSFFTNRWNTQILANFYRKEIIDLTVSWHCRCVLFLWVDKNRMPLSFADQEAPMFMQISQKRSSLHN